MGMVNGNKMVVRILIGDGKENRGGVYINE